MKKYILIALALGLSGASYGACNTISSDEDGSMVTDIKPAICSQALSKLERAVAKKRKEAQHNLGFYMVMGIQGVPKDVLKGVALMESAAAQDAEKSQKILAQWYYDGCHGLPVDYAKAFRWFKCRADKGFPDAQYQVARMYRDGRGVDVSLDEAERWCVLAANQGYINAIRALKRYSNTTVPVEETSKVVASWAIETGDAEHDLNNGSSSSWCPPDSRPRANSYVVV